MGLAPLQPRWPFPPQIRLVGELRKPHAHVHSTAAGDRLLPLGMAGPIVPAGSATACNRGRSASGAASPASALLLRSRVCCHFTVAILATKKFMDRGAGVGAGGGPEQARAESQVGSASRRRSYSATALNAAASAMSMSEESPEDPHWHGQIEPAHGWRTPGASPAAPVILAMISGGDAAGRTLPGGGRHLVSSVAVLW